MADRWRDEDRFGSGSRDDYRTERQDYGRSQGQYGDDNRDWRNQDNHEPYGGRMRSAYSGWDRPEEGRQYDDYTRRRNEARGGYGNQAGAPRTYTPWGGYGSGGFDERHGDRGKTDGYRGYRQSGFEFGEDDDDRNRTRDHRGSQEERGWAQRAGDEVRSWFGDDDAERRRKQDEHRGVGPKGYTRSDERIREDVCDRLSDDGRIDASDIEVTVKDSEVTLGGTVRDRQLKRRAEDLADDVSGVRHVQNNLRVQQSEATRTALGNGMTGSAPSPATKAATGKTDA